MQFCDKDRRSIGIVYYLFRVECGNAVDAAEVHLSFCGPVIGIVGKLVALQSVIVGVVAEFFGFGMKTTQSFVGAQPQFAVLVFQYSMDDVIGKSVGNGILLIFFPGFVKTEKVRFVFLSRKFRYTLRK